MALWEADSQQMHRSGISAISCDDFEDLIWTGTTQGQLTAWIPATPLVRYTSVPCHSQPIIQIMVAEHGVLSLAANCVTLTHRRGIVLFRKILVNATCMTRTKSELIISSQDSLYVINIYRGHVIKQVQDCNVGAFGWTRHAEHENRQIGRMCYRRRKHRVFKPFHFKG